MKLLYAEDEPTMAEAVVNILTYHNYLVDAVSDGEDALSYALSETYDGIILDIMMPKLSGLEVLQRLRSCCSLPKRKWRTGSRDSMPGQMIIFRSHLQWASCWPASARCCAAGRNFPRISSAAKTSP